MCCKQGPCIYGERLPDKPQCRFLLIDEADAAKGIETYRCGKYDEIRIIEERSAILPAMGMFGTGCCSPMFNSVRNRVIDQKLGTVVLLDLIDG
jgi:hypothetical protein